MNEHKLTDGREPVSTNGTGESSDNFYKLRNEEIRALCDKSLTHGAARLFILISKLVWFPNAGGMFKQMVGTLKCSVADLARYLGCNEKSFYRDSQKNRPGWIDLLTAGNYIWITKHHISNGEAMNIYHITVVRPRNEQIGFGFDSRFHGAPPTGENGNGVFLMPEGRGNSEVVETETGSSPKRVLGTGENGNSELVKTVTGSSPKRILPVTASTSDPLAKTVTASYRLHQFPTGENGNCQLVKTGDIKKNLSRLEIKERENGVSPTPDKAFEDWRRGLQDRLPGHLHALEKKIKERLATTQKPDVREGLKRQLKAVEECLLPTISMKPEASPVQPVKVAPQGKRMSPDEVKANWEKAKKISRLPVAVGTR